MSNEDGSVVIVFNGEIYNFMELRGELEAKGYTFHCGADTESLLHGYEEGARNRRQASWYVCVRYLG